MEANIRLTDILSVHQDTGYEKYNTNNSPQNLIINIRKLTISMKTDFMMSKFK